MVAEGGVHTLRVQGESHTLGQLIAAMAARQRPWDFATHLVPHPLSDEVHFKIGADSPAAARMAVALSCAAVEGQLDSLLQDLGVASSQQPEHPPAACHILPP
jgi:DNA-directed RNA polymerase subunit L